MSGPRWSAVVPARSWIPAFVVEAGDVLRVEDLDGRQAADVVIAPVDDPRDWLSCIYTQLLNRTTRITGGHVIYSKRARPLATVVADTVGVHWFGGGCCSAETNAFRYAATDSGSCRENLVLSLAGHVDGPMALELDACASLFMNISVGQDGAMEIVAPTSEPGDHIDLRTERDLLVAVSACPQERNPCNGFTPSAIGLSTWRP